MKKYIYCRDKQQDFIQNFILKKNNSLELQAGNTIRTTIENMNSDKQLSHQQLLIQRNNKITSNIDTKMIIDILSKENDNNKTYHIRNITKGIANKYPDFDNLSISKQRRVIMNILENDNTIFEKVGWGLWRLIDGSKSPSLSNDIPESKPRLPSISYDKNIIKPLSNSTQNIIMNHHPTHNVVKIRRRSSVTSAGGTNDHILLTSPKSNNHFTQEKGFIMPLYNSKTKERQPSISNINLQKHPHNQFNENALISSEEEEDANNGTDEEDWKTLGAENLLVNQRRKSYGGIIKLQSRKNSTVEENAAMLLVQLRRGSQ